MSSRSIRQKELTRLPFSTPNQKEAQNIIKNLWKDSKPFLTHFAKSWLNQSTEKLNSDYPAILIYHEIEYKDDEIIYYLDEENIYKKNIHIEIMNFDKYSSYETDKVQILNIDDKNLIGISFLSILSMQQRYYESVSNLHKRIIEVSKSNLTIRTQKHLIEQDVNSVENYLNNHKIELNFAYPAEVIMELNYIHSVYDWIDEGDSFIIALALEAYQEISYYHEWLDKHKVEEKRFREKISKIGIDIEELRFLTNAKPPFKYKIPQHPQDILHGLGSNYWDYYGRKKKLNDDGIQAIVKIISNYKRMPKKSIGLIKMEERNQAIDEIISVAKSEGLTDIEVREIRLALAFGIDAKFMGDTNK